MAMKVGKIHNKNDKNDENDINDKISNTYVYQFLSLILNLLIFVILIVPKSTGLCYN